MKRIGVKLKHLRFSETITTIGRKMTTEKNSIEKFQWLETQGRELYPVQAFAF